MPGPLTGPAGPASVCHVVPDNPGPAQHGGLMELAPDFSFQPLPAIQDQPPAATAVPLAEAAGGAAAAAPGPLGALAGLAGTWAGHDDGTDLEA